MTNNKNSTKYVSEMQEKYVAKILNGRTQPGSGASKFSKGDIINDDASLLIECKTCMEHKNSFSIKEEWITKNKEEARVQLKSNNALCFNYGPGEPMYFVIDEKLMRYLVEKLTEDIN